MANVESALAEVSALILRIIRTYTTLALRPHRSAVLLQDGERRFASPLTFLVIGIFLLGAFLESFPRRGFELGTFLLKAGPGTWKEINWLDTVIQSAPMLAVAAAAGVAFGWLAARVPLVREGLSSRRSGRDLFWYLAGFELISWAVLIALAAFVRVIVQVEADRFDMVRWVAGVRIPEVLSVTLTMYVVVAVPAIATFQALQADQGPNGARRRAITLEETDPETARILAAVVTPVLVFITLLFTVGAHTVTHEVAAALAPPVKPVEITAELGPDLEAPADTARVAGEYRFVLLVYNDSDTPVWMLRNVNAWFDSAAVHPTIRVTRWAGGEAPVTPIPPRGLVWARLAVSCLEMCAAQAVHRMPPSDTAATFRASVRLRWRLAGDYPTNMDSVVFSNSELLAHVPGVATR